MARDYKIEDIIRTANSSNIILTELSEFDPVFQPYILDVEDYWYYNAELPEDSEEYFYGPDCALCGRLAYPDEEPIMYNGQRFTVIFKKCEIVKTEGELEGFLQCVYCFQYYHRYKCSFELNDISYYEAKQSKSWACPICVPEFELQSITTCKNTKSRINWKNSIKIVVLFFKALYHLSNFMSSSSMSCSFVEILLFLYGTCLFLMFSFDTG